MTSRFIMTMGEEENANLTGDPDDYGANLKMWLDAETGITTSGSDVTNWVDRDSSIDFDVPGTGASAPQFEATAQNGLPGVNFEESGGNLSRKLFNNASFLDNFFSGAGFKSIAFAGRLDRLTDPTFNTNSTIISKGFQTSGGWQLFTTSNGTVRFDHRRSDNSVWSVSSSGFYNAGDLVLGYLTYDGGNTSGSGSFRLYDGADFVSVGSVSVGTASGIGTDDADTMVIGNKRDPGNLNSNAPFEGPLFGIWFTTPASNAFDEGYLARWIP